MKFSPVEANEILREKVEHCKPYLQDFAQSTHEICKKLDMTVVYEDMVYVPSAGEIYNVLLLEFHMMDFANSGGTIVKQTNMFRIHAEVIKPNCDDFVDGDEYMEFDVRIHLQVIAQDEIL